MWCPSAVITVQLSLCFAFALNQNTSTVLATAEGAHNGVLQNQYPEFFCWIEIRLKIAFFRINIFTLESFSKQCSEHYLSMLRSDALAVAVLLLFGFVRKVEEDFAPNLNAILIECDARHGHC